MNYRKYFRDNGFVLIRNVLPKNLVDRCLMTAKSIKYNKKKITKNMVFDEFNNKEKKIKYFQHIQLHYPIFFKLQNFKLLKIAKKILNQDVYFCSMGLHNKGPRMGTITPYHQDNFFNCKKPPFELTAYIPLENQSKINGQITYVKRSHRLGVLKHVGSKMKAFSGTIEDKSVVDPKKIFRSNLKPGDVIFHHTNVIHGADMNKSKYKTRFSVAVSIIGIKAKIDKRQQKIYRHFLKVNRSAN